MRRMTEYFRNSAAVLGTAAMVTTGSVLFDVNQINADAQETKTTITEENKVPSALEKDQHQLFDQESQKESTEQFSKEETITSGDDTTSVEAGTRVADGIFVTEQLDDEVTSNRYIGRSVYNIGNENVGDINDLVFSKEGGISAAVIGIGGFLGLGEKEVAVHFDAIQIVDDPENDTFDLVINASRQELENAPAFVTKAQKMAEEKAAEMKREQASRDVLKPVVPEPTQ